MPGRVKKPIVVLPLAFHVMNCKAFYKVKNFIVTGRFLLLRATLIEAPHPQELNYLAGKEAPSSVLINYLRRCNYSEYGIRKLTINQKSSSTQKRR